MILSRLAEELAAIFLAEVLAAGEDPRDWPSRQVANSVRIYPGPMVPDRARRVEADIRTHIAATWIRYQVAASAAASPATAVQPTQTKEKV